MVREAVKQTIDRLFSQLDQNNNGYLESREIESFMKMVNNDMGGNVQFKESDLQQFIDLVDNDRDGKISKDELIEFAIKIFSMMM